MVPHLGFEVGVKRAVSPLQAFFTQAGTIFLHGAINPGPKPHTNVVAFRDNSSASCYCYFRIYEYQHAWGVLAD